MYPWEDVDQRVAGEPADQAAEGEQEQAEVGRGGWKPRGKAFPVCRLEPH